MRNVFTNSPLTVRAGNAWSGVATRPETLQIVSGSAWVTIEGDRHDYWLSAGDKLAIAPQRVVVIESDRSDSRIGTVASASHGIAARLADVAAAAWRQTRHAVADRIGGGAAQRRDMKLCYGCEQ